MFEWLLSMQINCIISAHISVPVLSGGAILAPGLYLVVLALLPHLLHLLPHLLHLLHHLPHLLHLLHLLPQIVLHMLIHLVDHIPKLIQVGLFLPFYSCSAPNLTISNPKSSRKWNDRRHTYKTIVLRSLVPEWSWCNIWFLSYDWFTCYCFPE